MGMLHRLADRDKQFQPLMRRELGLIAIVGQWHALDQLHDEVRLSGFADAGVENLGDVWMIHERQSLALLLEAGEHSSRIGAGANHLERHAALHRFSLVSDKDNAHSAFAQLLAKLKPPGEHLADFQTERLIGSSAVSGWLPQKTGRLLVSLKQCFDALPQLCITGAFAVQYRWAIRGRSVRNGHENFFYAL